MSEWWTYRLSDFLMFSARTYYRLFELYNTEIWPAQWVALGLGVGLSIVSMARRPGAALAVGWTLAACWFWVAWAFHLQRYAGIHSAAPWFAAAFAVEALLLLGSGALGAGWRPQAGSGRRGKVGMGLLLFAIWLQPGLGALLGRPWQQAEVFGLAPDPTVLATLGWLVLMRPADKPRKAPAAAALAWLLWPIPLLWCGVTGATLWALAAPDALLMPAAALLAVVAAWRWR